MVEELLGFDPPGEGPHHWIRVRCRQQNTHDVARKLAESAGVALRDVGFSGLKDRVAVTTQWFSLPRNPVDAPLPESLRRMFASDPGIELVCESANARKLKRGTHRGNRFAIVLRELSAAPESCDDRLAIIRAQGVPNYFGPQRFGRRGSNLAHAQRLSRNGRLRVSRQARSLALSAARAFLFNAVLSRRVANGTWNHATPGDVMQLAGSRSHFHYDGSDPAVADRIAAWDIHPTGPLWGRGESPATESVQALEREVCGTRADFTHLLESAGLRQERRALRLRPAHLTWTASGDSLALRFELPAGTFATAVLRELVATS